MEGKLGIGKRDSWLLLEAVHSTPPGSERLLDGNWNGEILVECSLGPHLRKQCCFYKLDRL